MLAAAAAEEEEAEAAAQAAAEAGAMAHAEAVVAARDAEAAAAKARAERLAAEEAEAAAAAMRAAEEQRIAALGPGLPPPRPRDEFGLIGLPPPPNAFGALAPAGLPPIGSLPGASSGGIKPAPPPTGDDDEEPADYLCPITHELMTDPVVTADGQSYERYAIEQWLRHSTLSPLTNEPLTHLNLTPNMALRRLIREWIAQRDANAADKALGNRSQNEHSRRAAAVERIAVSRCTPAEKSKMKQRELRLYTIWETCGCGGYLSI